MDTLHDVQPSPEVVLERLDTIIRELQELRQVVLTRNRPAERNVTAQLYGVLGQGTWDEYDLHLDWQRFAS